MVLTRCIWKSCVWRLQAMLSTTTATAEFPKVRTDAETVLRASIASVSPVELISKALSFDTRSNILSIEGRQYHINNNVKIVAFGKAVLGMTAGVEHILGNHIKEGVVSVPVGALETAQKYYPHYLPQMTSKIRIYEGAAGNLPDSASEAAAKEVLSVARRCGEGDILLVLVSGGGSALLSCPVKGITLEEKREVVQSLSKRGANIQELNAIRSAISQTKGGKLAATALPAQVVALILSDVVGDPLDVIASGPTVAAHHRGTEMGTIALAILQKFGLQDTIPNSVRTHLESVSNQSQVSSQSQVMQSETEAHNVLIGSNRTATSAAKAAAISLGYSCYIWSRHLEGEARFLGELYALITQYMLQKLLGDKKDLQALRETLHDHLSKLALGQQQQQLETDAINLMKMLDTVSERPFCLVGAGEPTVTVTGTGRGGRNQELALAYSIKLDELRRASGGGQECQECPNCVFASIGTDGQDGPCDAAGSIVTPSAISSANEQGLDPLASLLNNDSYSFFTELDSGRNLVKTGLTGTNVMDIHLLLIN